MDAKKSYEIMLILEKGSAYSEKGVFFENFGETLKAVGGKALKEDFWGSRKFAYLIKKSEQGVYTVIEFECPPDKIKEVEGKLKLEKGIVRYLISQKSKITSQNLEFKSQKLK